MRRYLFIITTLLLSAAMLALSNPATGSDVPREPSLVYILGRQLIVEKRLPNGFTTKARPYIIRGITWCPATRAPADGPDPFNPAETVQYGFFFDWPGREPSGSTVFVYWMKNQHAEHYKKDIPLMKELNVNTVRVYDDFGDNPETVMKILDEFYKNDIMVILTVASSKYDIDTKRYIKTVNMCKKHPAILMWSLGNEWNLEYNKYWGYPTVRDAAIATNEAAREIARLDPYHPVSSSLGDRFSDKKETNTVPWIIKECAAVDVWGFNIYRGKTFGDLFNQWRSISKKPMYISEFGIDSFRTLSYKRKNEWQADDCIGEEDQNTQAEYDVALWGSIVKHLSALNPAEQCAGGTIHSFNDHLWKVGSYQVSLGELVEYYNSDDSDSYSRYNTEGYFLPGAAQDNVANEEYFGVVDADRKPKESFRALKKYHEKLGKLQCKTN